MNFTLNPSVVTRVLDVVDAGLSKGLGQRNPGSMCVEAAVCYALGLPHGDDPQCVSQAVRALKIRLNDSAWSSNRARAKGMRKLAVLQLGTNTNFSDKEFVERVTMYVINVTVADLYESLGSKYDKQTKALRSAKTLAEGKTATAAAMHGAASDEHLSARAARTAANSASAAANAASAAKGEELKGWAYSAAAHHAAETAYVHNAAGFPSRDAVLSKFAEDVCQILIKMGVQGVKYLDLIDKS